MAYEDYLSGEPVIITAALTGGVHGKETNPNIPETPDEIGRAAGECEDAGAAIVHLHARKPSGERSFDPARFQAINDAVRAHTTDIIIQNSTGGTGAPLAERRQSLRTTPPPEMASLDMGPMNRYDHLTSENTRGTINALYDEMAANGIKPEIEVFNNGHLNETHALLNRRDLNDPVYINLIFGTGTLTRPTPRNFLAMIDDLPTEAIFNTLAFGPHQLPFTTMGILLGGHVRVGLEDNVYFERGVLAERNAQLVERTAAIANHLNRPIATPTEARGILGLDGHHD